MSFLFERDFLYKIEVYIIRPWFLCFVNFHWQLGKDVKPSWMDILKVTLFLFFVEGRLCGMKGIQFWIFKKRDLPFRFFFLAVPFKKKRRFFLCPFFALFFFRGFFFNPFFFCSASFCLFDNLSILSDCWCCLGCRQCRSN